MDINLINSLFDSGALKALHEGGFISGKIFSYREIFLWVRAQMETHQVSKNQAVLEAELQFKKDERTIWRALSKFSEL